MAIYGAAFSEPQRHHGTLFSIAAASPQKIKIRGTLHVPSGVLGGWGRSRGCWLWCGAVPTIFHDALAYLARPRLLL